MDVDCIKFIHVRVSDRVASLQKIIYGGVSLQVRSLTISVIYGVSGSQSDLEICIVVGCSFEIHQLTDHLGRYHRRSQL